MYKYVLFENNNSMTNEKYDLLIKRIIPKEKIFKNMMISFFSGGLIGLIAQILVNFFMNYFNESDSYLLSFTTFVVIGSVLTGLGIFDKVLSVCKCGLLVPSTGFANSMTSASMYYRSEGFIKGIGSSIFKLTGSIILYGIVFGIIFGYIRSLIL